MAYIDVLPLAEIKIYLRVDDTQNETDAELTSMINSALKYIEKTTNVMVYARNKDFDVVCGEVLIYDHPINTLIDPTTGVSTEKKRLYTIYTLDDADVDTLTLNVGYTLPADVPDDIIELAKIMVKVMFYEQETNQSFKEMLPAWAISILNNNRRFLV